MSTITADTADLDGLEPSQRRELIVRKVCAWSGPSFVVLFLVMWARIAGWFPPPHEDWDLATVVRFYADNSVRIRLGMGSGSAFSTSSVSGTSRSARSTPLIPGRLPGGGRERACTADRGRSEAIGRG